MSQKPITELGVMTDELRENLTAQTYGKTDYFTVTDDYPKAFRVGECKVISPERTEFQVLLFWRDDTRTEQREINVEVAKQSEKWLVDKVLGVPPSGG